MKKKLLSQKIFILLMLCSTLLYLYRINWGIVDVDEGFYLCIPYRLLQGDALLVEEWHVSQLSAILIYPILKIYLSIVQTTDGIFLAFRYIFIIFHAIVSLCSYYILKNKDHLMALCISLLFYLFIPFNIMTLSYNTMGLDLVFLCAVISSTNTPHNASKSLWSGIFLALAILCNPYLVIIYFLYSIIVIYHLIRKKSSLFLYNWFFLTIGSIIILCIFLLFVFSRASLKDIFENMPLILTNPAHNPKTFSTFWQPIMTLIRTYKWYAFSFSFVSLGGYIAKQFRKICFSLAVIISMIICVYLAVFQRNGIGFAAIMLPLTPLGIVAFLYSTKKNWLILNGYIWGIIYAFCMNLSSNTGIYVIANACTISSCFSLWLIYEYCKETFIPFHYTAIITFILVSQLFSETYIIINHVFTENGPYDLVCEINKGPLNGIVTTKEKYNIYNQTFENLLKVKNNFDTDNSNILLFKNFPCGYLMMENLHAGTYSAWLFDEITDLDDERMNLYFTIHPHKIPRIIYIDSKSSAVWTEREWYLYAQKNNYTCQKFNDGAFLLSKP